MKDEIAAQTNAKVLFFDTLCRPSCFDIDIWAEDSIQINTIANDRLPVLVGISETQFVAEVTVSSDCGFGGVGGHCGGQLITDEDFHAEGSEMWVDQPI